MNIEACGMYLSGGGAVIPRTLTSLLEKHYLTSPSGLKSICIQYEKARSETYFRIYDEMLKSFRGEGFQPKQKLYEFGVGPGVLASRFKDSGLIVVGTDIGDYRREEVGFPNLAITKDRLPFASETFDYVSVTSVLHHIPPKEHVSCLAELKRILKPDGVILIQEDERGRSAIEQLAIRVVDRLVSGPEADSHRSEDEWTGFFKNNGLTIKSLQKICHRKGPIRLNKIFFALTLN